MVTIDTGTKRRRRRVRDDSNVSMITLRPPQCGQTCSHPCVRVVSLSPRILRLIAELDADWRRLDQRLEALSARLATMATASRCCMPRSISALTVWQS